MPFELSTLAGRHLTSAYAIVFLVQGGYFLWMIAEWRKTSRALASKKITGAS